MNSLLMTADNGQKVYDGRKTKTRRVGSEEVQSLLTDFAGKDDPSPLEFVWAENGLRLDDERKPYRYTGLLAWLEEYPDEGSIELPCPYRVGELRYIREAHYLYGRWQRQGKTKTGRPKYRFLADRSRGACYPSNPPPRVCTNRRKVGWFRRSGLFMPEWAARTFVKIVSVRAERVQAIGQGSACAEGCPIGVEPIGWFSTLWDAIHGPGAWARNEWVWVIEMEKVTR